jgi:hypothetical protein
VSSNRRARGGQAKITPVGGSAHWRTRIKKYIIKNPRESALSASSVFYSFFLLLFTFYFFPLALGFDSEFMHKLIEEIMDQTNCFIQ